MVAGREREGCMDISTAKPSLSSPVFVKTCFND